MALTAASADDAKPKPSSKRDKRVLEILEQAADLVKNAKSLHVEVALEFNVQNGEDKQAFQTHCTYDWEKPHRFALRNRNLKDKNSGLDYISDGKSLLVHAMRFKQYTQSPAPANLADIPPKLAAFSRANTGFLVPNLLTDDPYDSLADDIISCSYAGKEKLGDVETHHIKIVHPEIKWEGWIAAEGKPLFLKATSLVAVDEYRATGLETYKNWKLDEAPDKAVFTITPPTGAEKVDAIGPPKRKK
jgi:hypothetical protein